jgi:PAS domain S-box-containing protein
MTKSTKHEKLHRLTHDSGERVKGLNCLYGLSELVEQRDITLEGIFRGLAELMRPAWQYPEITCARVVFEDEEFKTENFKRTRWKQSADIKVHGRKAGTVEAYYLEKKPKIDEGPFLKEERKLIETITKRLGGVVERIQVEEALAEEHSLLRTLIDNLPDHIYVKDTKSRFTLCNVAVAHGVRAATLEELVGKTDFDFFPKELASRYYADEQEIIRSGQLLVNIEEPTTDRAGKSIWFSTTKVPLRDSHGKIVGIVGMGRDITERKKAEEQLKTINQQLKANEQQLRAANQQLKADEQQLKAANQQLRADEQQLKAANQQLKANEQQLKAANQQLRANEQQLKAANQQLRATEETLRESEEKYRTLTENSLTGIFIHQDEKYVFVNDRFAEIHGYKAEELLGKEFWTLVHPDEKKVVARIRSKRPKGKKVAQRYEVRRLKKDGQTIWCEIMISHIEYMGKPAIMGNIINITERKQAEQKLLEYQSQLKSLASELSLTEEHERRRIATELHAAIGQSLVISKLQLDTLRATALSGELGKTLEEVCRLLDETIQSTRSLTFDLSSPILHELGFETAVAEWLTERIQKKHGIATEFEDDEQPKPLNDDIRALLFRDVRELLVNVVKHAQAEKIKVSIRKVGSQIHVSVEDDGVGFDPAEVVLMSVRRGGFGLFSIRERLEQLDGHLEIESEPGQGTKVALMAPLKEQKLKDKGQV